MPYKVEHSSRLQDPNKFDPKAFRRTVGGTIYGKIKVPKTISIIWGKLKGKAKPSDNPIPQSLRFQITDWTAAKAKKWLKDNNVKYIKFEPAVKSESDLKIIDIKVLDKKDMQESLEEGLRPPFANVGGKVYLAETIIRCFPENFKVFCEPFAGSAAVLFRKKPTEKEIINDLDKDAIFAFKKIKSITDEEIRQIKNMNWKSSRNEFEKLKDKKDFKNDLERLYRFLYVVRFSFSSNRKNYKPSDEGKIATVAERLPQIKERLKNVIIESLDYKVFINKYDSKETFFYIDPPYINLKGDHPFDITGAGLINPEEFGKTVRGIRGKCLISEVSHPKTLKILKGFYIKKLEQDGLKRKFRGDIHSKTENINREILASNYELKDNTKYLESIQIAESLRLFEPSFEEANKELLETVLDKLQGRTMKQRVDLLETKLNETIKLLEQVRMNSKNMNSPTFAFYAVYNKMPEQWLSGQSGHKKRLWRDIPIDVNIKDEWLEQLSEIKEIEMRASCQGSSKEQITYIVFRLLPKYDKYAENVVKELNEQEDIYSKTDVGFEQRPRIVIGGKTFYGDINFTEWWEDLAEKIKTALKNVIVDLKIKESRHRRDQCMDCSKPPTIEVLWANAKGHAWWCDKHFKEWFKEHKGDVDYIKDVKDSEAAKKFSDNTNPNIKDDYEQ